MTARAPQQGFVLVGVVMLVLALTILGITLYGLSSYEAVFLQQTHDENAAIYRAQGGMDMVLAMLTKTDSLPSAKAVVGYEGITYAVAMQRRAIPAGTYDSTGLVQPDSLVFVTVRTQQGGREALLTAAYRPQNYENYYKRLFTIANRIDVPGFSGTVPGLNDRRHTITLNGNVWQGGTDHDWVPPGDEARITWTHSDSLRTDRLSPPDVASWMGRHLAGAPVATIQHANATQDSVELASGGGTPTFYTLAYTSTPPTYPVDPNYSFSVGRYLRIYVSGTVVLMFPHGFECDKQLTVTGRTADACLIIVAGRSGTFPPDHDAGINIQGGIQNSYVPTILASDGRVYLDADQGFVLNPNELGRLSVFAKHLELLGPASPGYFRMTYDPIPMGSVIDGLPSDCLPLPTGASRSSFQMVAGSWRDLTP